MSSLPMTVNPATAPLPAKYEAAKVALAECQRIDECQDWANKAEALASYARQADDDSLRQMADRIQARAVRRAGELLRQFQAPGRRTDTEPREGTLPRSATEAATQAGMSEYQRKTAVRVANVPEDEFEAAVESEAPPTVTQLAEAGKQPRPAPEVVTVRGPERSTEVTKVLGALRRFAEAIDNADPETAARQAFPCEVEELRNCVHAIDGWLDRFVVNLAGVIE